MTGGTFNWVIGRTVINPSVDYPDQLILRVPRIAWMSRPDHEVATLRYGRRQSSVPVADIKASDFTCDSPLQDQYVIQGRIAGTDLRTAIWNDLNH